MVGTPQSHDSTLIVSDLFAGYGAQTIICGVSIQVEQGKIASLLGPNGAGKSTLLKAIGGIVKCFSGNVMLGAVDITNLRTERLAMLGIGYVPQVEDVFPSMTVLENLEMGGYLLPRDVLRNRIEQSFIKFPKLADFRRRRACTLSGGERKILAIARVLMVDHHYLLLDEPTAGLSPSAAARILGDIVRNISSQGVGVLIVEQRARAALEISDWGYILVNGQLRASQTALELLERQDLGELLIGKRISEE